MCNCCSFSGTHQQLFSSNTSIIEHNTSDKDIYIKFITMNACNNHTQSTLILFTCKQELQTQQETKLYDWEWQLIQIGYKKQELGWGHRMCACVSTHVSTQIENLVLGAQNAIRTCSHGGWPGWWRGAHTTPGCCPSSLGGSTLWDE